MNIPRMLELADELETSSRLKINFNMRDFIDAPGVCYDERVTVNAKSCGTTACIGGHACLLFGRPGSHIGEENAKRLLELTQDQADRLFYNYDRYVAEYNDEIVDFEYITREQAARAVRRMVAEEGGE